MHFKFVWILLTVTAFLSPAQQRLNCCLYNLQVSPIMADEDYDHYQKKSIKIVLVGESGVGKSNIISRYIENKFSLGANTTIGLQFSEKHVSVNNKVMVLQVWDTAGQQRYRALNKAFYKNALGGLVIFDLSNRKSFENLDSWMTELKDNLQEIAVLLLVGNKCDIAEQEVSVGEALQYAKKYNMGFIQTSAAMGTNIKQAFELITKKILERVEQIKYFEMKSVKQKPLTLQPKKVQAVTGKGAGKKKCCS